MEPAIESLPHYESTTISGRFPGNNARRCIIAGLAGSPAQLWCRRVRTLRMDGLDRPLALALP